MSPEARLYRVIESFRSPSLAGNMLDIATTRSFIFHLPASYDKGDKRYPVIYALPLWTDGNANDFGIPDALGRWVQAGKIPEAIIVEVDMQSTEYVGDFYQSNPVVGDWVGYIAEDLVSYIDGKYRTLPDPASRAIIGLEDAGGGGALIMGLRRPDVFGVVVTMAPGIGSEPFLKDCAIKAYFTGSGHMWAPPWACKQLAVALSLSFASNSVETGIPVYYREVVTPAEWGHHYWDNDMLLDFLSKQLVFE